MVYRDSYRASRVDGIAIPYEDTVAREYAGYLVLNAAIRRYSTVDRDK